MQSFYENKNVFITGGSGLLGRVLIENLLRKTEVKCIYMLIRDKHGRTAYERIKEILVGPLFAKLSQLKPSAFTLITPVHGDCAQPQLGISREDRKMLTENVDVVIHCAATVRFNEPLYNALLVNVGATRDLLKMAKDMPQLKAFIHISTAFANCVLPHIEEKFYPQLLGIDASKTLDLAELLGPELTNDLTTKLVRKFPNTYTFTKSLAEELIRKEAKTLPICILRPSIITPTYAEPIRGWMDNSFGVMGTLMALALGSLRVLSLHSNIVALLVPVDFCANLILACGYKVGQLENAEKEKAEPTIYNFVPSASNSITLGALTDSAIHYGKERPLSNTNWYPFFIKVNLLEVETFLGFFLHIIPAYIQDIWRLMHGEKARMFHRNQKQQQFLNALHHFKTTVWTYNVANTQNLWISLSATDQMNFNFNVDAIIWKRYCRDIIFGMRRYLAKEGDETIPEATKRLKMLKLAHQSIILLMFTCLLLFAVILVRFLLDHVF
ncbi:fatty acyl-CoA reductase wat-like [Anastrepha ludens]|uniref:fatty acyl-CoA reductase wat-like n=1 Tax=Anastrepha ludens TaxID=28586 RepID=UPI0023B0713D|nr:fatty acyl-CoA reductase wat-like [Anastrepha ludens]